MTNTDAVNQSNDGCLLTTIAGTQQKLKLNYQMYKNHTIILKIYGTPNQPDQNLIQRPFNH